MRYTIYVYSKRHRPYCRRYYNLRNTLMGLTNRNGLLDNDGGEIGR